MFLLGNRLVRSKTTDFESVIMSSNLISPASFRISSAKLINFLLFRNLKVDPVVFNG